MKSAWYILFLLLSSNISFATAKNADPANCSESKQMAIEDIKKGKINFLIQGGFAPVHYEGQEVFEKKYEVRYFQFGCVVPANICLDTYNREVAKHLDKQYGKIWRREVRKDVMF